LLLLPIIFFFVRQVARRLVAPVFIVGLVGQKSEVAFAQIEPFTPKASGVGKAGFIPQHAQNRLGGIFPNLF
jgi:hypothetical protein